MRMLVTLALMAAVAAPVLAETKPPTDWQPAYSGNYTAVSYDRGINYIVIHVTEGSASGAVSWFKNPSSNVSAHYVVSKTGYIYQCVLDKNIAWHAGNWYYNTHAIGIEHEGYTNSGGFTQAQYEASAWLVRWLCQQYGIPKDRNHIIGHKEVPGATHTDPGPYWNWDGYMNLVKYGSSGGSTPPPPPPPPPPPNTSALKAVKVTTSSLNVRSGPGTGYGIIATISSGQIYVSMQQQNGWYKIWYNGATGWCYGGYLQQTGTYVAKVTSSTLNVRSGPGTGYAIVGQSYSGQMYSLISSTSWSDGWNKIYFKSGAYYSYSGYMSEYWMN